MTGGVTSQGQQLWAATLEFSERTCVRLFGSPWGAWLHEFLVFGLKEAAACIFAGSFLLLLVISGTISIPGLARYDLLFVGAIAIQIALIAARLETRREVAVLSLFHAIGMGLELFKTSAAVGSWSYPEAGVLRLGTVPLYSGFMYAAVASYLMQAWRLLDVRITAFPPRWLAVGLSVAIYGNFFTNHFVPDVRWLLAIGVLIVLWRTTVRFTVTTIERRMPMIVAFGLVGFFLWVAENIATFFGAWVYPNQAEQWAIVGPAKISSWALLVIITFIIVAALKGAFPKGPGGAVPADAVVRTPLNGVRAGQPQLRPLHAQDVFGGQPVAPRKK